MPSPVDSIPIPPNKWRGRVMYPSIKRTVIRSSMTRIVRSMPYFDLPYWRARCGTGTSATVTPIHAATAGTKRCIWP